MADETIKCPICAQETSNRFCESCGFELHILPEGVSEEVKKYEAERVEKYKKAWKELQESEMKVKELSDRLLAQDNNKQKEIEDLTQKNKSLQEELNRTQEKVNFAQSEIPIAYLSMMQGESILAILGIYEGENSFGYAKTHDRHQQIICNANVSDVHFTIRAVSSLDPKGRKRTHYYVAPKDGRIFGSANGANIIGSEREFEKNESVFIDDVKFTLVANKK